MHSGIESRIVYKHTDDVTKDSVGILCLHRGGTHFPLFEGDIATNWGKQ